MSKEKEDKRLEIPSDPLWIQRMVKEGKVAQLDPVELPKEGENPYKWVGPEDGLLYLGYPFCSAPRVSLQAGAKIGDQGDPRAKLVAQSGKLIMETGYKLHKVGSAPANQCLIFVRADIYKAPSQSVEVTPEVAEDDELAEQEG